MPEWHHRTGRLSVRWRGAALDEDVLDEIAEHLEELYRPHASPSGRRAAAARAHVEDELTNLPALTRAAAAARVAARRHAARRRPPVGPAACQLRARSVLRPPAARRAARIHRLAVLTLALGIGANTAFFSIVNTLLSPAAAVPRARPPGDDLGGRRSPTRQTCSSCRSRTRKTGSRQSTSFEQHGDLGVPALQPRRATASPSRSSACASSHGLFPMLGVEPQLGRTFTAAKMRPATMSSSSATGSGAAASRARPDIIGRTMRVNGRPHEIIGVMPPAFMFTSGAPRLGADRFQRERCRTRLALVPIGRATEAGRHVRGRKAELEAIGRRLAAEHRRQSRRVRHDHADGGARRRAPQADAATRCSAPSRWCC